MNGLPNNKNENQSPFDRLPEEVKEEIRKKKASEEEELVQAEQRYKKRLKIGIVVGAFVSMFISYPPRSFDWIYLLMLGVSGGIAVFLIIKYRLSFIVGIIVYWISGYMCTVVRFLNVGTEYDMSKKGLALLIEIVRSIVIGGIIVKWLMDTIPYYILAGLLLTLWAQHDRDMKDSPY